MVRSGTAAMSPAAHASGTPTTRRLVDHDARRGRRPEREAAASGDAFTPAVQTSVSAANTSPSDRRTSPPRGVEPARCAARCAFRSRRRVGREVGIQFGQDPGPASIISQRWSRCWTRDRAGRRPRQIFELAEPLDAGEPRSDEHEGQGRATSRDIGQLCRAIELREHTVPQPDRLREVLEARWRARRARGSGAFATRSRHQDHDVVVDLSDPPPGSRTTRASRSVIDALHLADHQSDRRSTRRNGTTTARGSISPLATSGRNGWYSMKFSGFTTTMS